MKLIPDAAVNVLTVSKGRSKAQAANTAGRLRTWRHGPLVLESSGERRETAQGLG